MEPLQILNLSVDKVWIFRPNNQKLRLSYQKTELQMRERNPLDPFLQNNPEGNAVLLALSNLNLPPKKIAVSGIRRLHSFLDAIQGERSPAFLGRWDITPTRRLALDSMLGRFKPGDAIAVHQTWPEDPMQKIRKGAPLASHVLNAVALAVMPEEQRSQKRIIRMSEQLGNVHRTVYLARRGPDGKVLFPKIHGGGLAGVQIKPEDVNGVAGGDIEKYLRFIEEDGINGIIVDKHHLTRAGKTEDERLDWEQTLQYMEEAKVPILGLHASAGRTDATHRVDRETSQADLRAVLTGPEAIGRTVMGEVLATSYRIWADQREQMPEKLPELLPATFEATHESMDKHRGGNITDADFREMTYDAGQSLNEYFNSLRIAAS